MRLGSFSFIWIILGSGVLCLLVIIGNLSLLGLHRSPEEPHLYVAGGSPERGLQAISRHGCGGCHVISGIRTATGRVGPKLEEFNRQTYIAGQLMNSPENLVSWIRDPKNHAPNTVMPNLDVTEQEARDIAEYLYQH